jgi:hypothetical protein
MERIAADLSKIEGEFESKLGELAQKCQTRLSAVCSDAELAIISAHDTCAAEFKSMSSQQRAQIDEKTQELLSQIDRVTQTALQAMRSAAGDKGAAGKSGQAATASASPSPGSSSNAEASFPGSSTGGAGGSDDDLFGDFGDLKL